MHQEYGLKTSSVVDVSTSRIDYGRFPWGSRVEFLVRILTMNEILRMKYVLLQTKILTSFWLIEIKLLIFI